MLAQRRHLEKQLIENYNKGESIRKEEEVKTMKSTKIKEELEMLKEQQLDFKKSHIS